MMMRCYCNCARVGTAAQLEDVNMAGVRSPNVFILFFEKGVVAGAEKDLM